MSNQWEFSSLLSVIYTYEAMYLSVWSTDQLVTSTSHEYQYLSEQITSIIRRSVSPVSHDCIKSPGTRWSHPPPLALTRPEPEQRQMWDYVGSDRQVSVGISDEWLVSWYMLGWGLSLALPSCLLFNFSEINNCSKKQIVFMQRFLKIFF